MSDPLALYWVNNNNKKIRTIKIGNDEIRNVEKFKFWASYLTPEGDSVVEIKNRLGRIINVVTRFMELWNSKDLKNEGETCEDLGLEYYFVQV